MPRGRAVLALWAAFAGPPRPSAEARAYAQKNEIDTHLLDGNAFSLCFFEARGFCIAIVTVFTPGRSSALLPYPVLLPTGSPPPQDAGWIGQATCAAGLDAEAEDAPPCARRLVPLERRNAPDAAVQARYLLVVVPKKRRRREVQGL